MRRAGWQVWLATDLPGNYEECPANLIDFAKRDRRWLQGNLQHTRLIVARGFHAVNRLHFALGILSYVASPLWFALLLLSCVIAWRAQATSAAAELAARGLPWSFSGQALALFGATLVLLLMPKMLALLDLRRRPGEAVAFGGWGRIAGSVVLETVVFTLIAPILMLFHTKFVVLTLCRRTIAWGSQRRGAAGDAALAEAFSAHLGQTLFGGALALFIARLSPALAGWMSPMLAGMIFSIPISYVTGSVAIGARLRAWGLFVTPEETAPSPELRRLTEALAVRTRGRAPLPELADDYGLLQAVIDPYVNAAHVSLLRSKDHAPVATELRLVDLRERLMREGPSALSARDRIAVLSDVDSMVALHEEVWAAPPARLAAWWRLALEHYHVVAVAPQTAFSRAAA